MCEIFILSLLQTFLEHFTFVHSKATKPNFKFNYQAWQWKKIFFLIWKGPQLDRLSLEEKIWGGRPNQHGWTLRNFLKLIAHYRCGWFSEGSGWWAGPSKRLLIGKIFTFFKSPCKDGMPAFKPRRMGRDASLQTPADGTGRNFSKWNPRINEISSSFEGKTIE